MFGSGELFTVAVCDDQLLIGLAPMFILWWKGRRQDTFIGNGVSDEFDFIVDKSCAPGAAEAIPEEIAAQRSSWDLCDLQDLPPCSILHHVQPPAALTSELRVQYTCTWAPLPFSRETFEERLPHGLRRNLRRYRTKLEQIGRVVFETADAGSTPEHLNAVIALHCARWSARDEPGGMLARRQMETFQRSAAEALYRRGMARFYGLKLDARIIASAYALTDGHRACRYPVGFHREFERFNPGSLILEYAMARGIEEGLREFDFLRGDEPYKLTWGAVPRHSHRLLLWHDEAHRPL